MKTAMRRILTMLLCVTLLVSALPADQLAKLRAASAETSDSLSEETAASKEDAHPIMERDFTAVQRENAQTVAALLTAATDEVTQGDFRYVVLSDGTAAITGYSGAAVRAQVPLTLGDADVVALAPGAFGVDVRVIGIHGNVLYIDGDAMGADAVIIAWQGTYAATWAQQHGHPLESETEGTLFEDVEDMTDVLDRTRVLSETSVSMGATESRRLNVGDKFMLRRGDADELFYSVAAKRTVGKRVYLTVDKIDYSQVFDYRLYEGEMTTTHTFTDTQEVGVEQEEDDVQGAALTLEQHQKVEKEKYDLNKSYAVKTPGFYYGIKSSVTVTYEVTTISSYSVEVEEGKVTEGWMGTDQTQDIKIEIKGKASKSFFTSDMEGSGGFGSAEARDKALETLRKFRGTQDDKKLGSVVVYIIPSIGLGIEIAPKIGYEFGGEGSLTFHVRTYTPYKYQKETDTWTEDRKDAHFRKKLPAPDPELEGMVFAKVSSVCSVKLIVAFAFAGSEISAEAALKFSVSVPGEKTLEGECITCKLSFSVSITVQVGVWFSMGPLDLKFTPDSVLGIPTKYSFSLLDITLSDRHFGVPQGFHWASQCANSPNDYHIRFRTNSAGWQPDSICYLKKGTYSNAPVPIKFLTFSAGADEEVSVMEVEGITVKDKDVEEAIKGEITLPKKWLKPVKWRVIEPDIALGYEWNQDKTVGENLEAMLGKKITKAEDLPKVITLEQDDSDLIRVDYDANGGSFPNLTGNNTIFTQYYSKDESSVLPTVEPTITMGLFKEWTLDVQGNEPWEAGVEIREDMRVYAQYERLDPTDHYSVNAKYGMTPTLIGDAQEIEAEEINYEVYYDVAPGINMNQYHREPTAGQLDRIFKDGIENYEQRVTDLGVLKVSGSWLNMIKGKCIVVNEKPVGFTITGLVDETKYWSEFTIPSSINGLPVYLEDMLGRVLNARIVKFSKATTLEGAPSLTATDSHMFEGNDTIEYVYMDDTSLIRLGDFAFMNCTNLKGVSLPGTMQEIGQKAFYGCPLIKEAVLGRIVDTVGEDAFTCCENLTKVTVDTPYLKSMEKAFGETGLKDEPAKIKLVLDEYVMVLPREAFASCKGIKSLEVKKDKDQGGRLKTIGRAAFMYDTGLEEIDLKEGLTTIESYAFCDTRIRNAVIPESVTYFFGAPGCTAGYDGTDMVFMDTPLESLTIGSENLPRLSMGMFFYRSKTLKEVYVRDGVTAIGTSTFSYHKSLETVRLPETLKTLGESVFQECPKLKRVGVDPVNQSADVVLPSAQPGQEGLTAIPDHTFQNCSALTSAVIPKGVETIGWGAFSGCTSLQSVSIPKSLKTIEFDAFYNCENLTSANLPEGLERIERRAFYNTRIKNVNIPSTVNFLAGAPGCREGFTGQTDAAFAHTPIESLTIGGKGLTSITANTFTDPFTAKMNLRSVYLRDEVTNIDGAFYMCKDLEAVRLPSNLESIGDETFYGCENLKKVGVDFLRQTVDLDLPNTVKSIGEKAFEGCKSLTSVNIPGSVTSIGNNAFNKCEGLKAIELHEGLESIGNQAFSNTIITEIIIPESVTSMEQAFVSTPLQKITLGGKMKAILPGYFRTTQSLSQARTLKEVILRDGVETISSGFNDQSALKSVRLPKTLQSIGTYAFSGCTSLEKVGVDPENQTDSVVLPDVMKDVPAYLFAKCASLTSVMLPRDAESIEAEAFIKCTSLEKVVAGPKLAKIGRDAFKNSDPVFYRMPGTERNEWLANWCAANGFEYRDGGTDRVNVSFDDNQADEVSAAAVVTVGAFELIPEPEAPEREGYVFMGWFSGNSETPWNFAEDRVGSYDIKLTARWMKVTGNLLFRVEDDQAVLVSCALSDEDSTVVTIPAAWQGYPVTGIDDGAFEDEPVTGLVLPAEAANLTADTFDGANDLAWIKTPAYSRNYAARDGMLYSADMTELVFCPPQAETRDFTVPDGVKTIGAYAFYDRVTLRSVTFNDTLTRIGEGAFGDCANLTEIELPDSLEKIGANAFRRCAELRTVWGAANCKSIGGNAFAETGYCVFYGEEDSALVRYAKANDRLYNLYPVYYMLDGAETNWRLVQRGTEVPVWAQTTDEDRVETGIWYSDSELTQRWDFATMTMPADVLTLYSTTVPLYETENYIPDQATSANGLRVTRYNGKDTEITVPDKIGKDVRAVDAAGFPEGGAVYLPGNLLEVDVQGFIDANITLYAPAGSATEQLLKDAGCEINAITYTVSFDTGNGAQVEPIRAKAGETIVLPECVQDGGSLLGWYTSSAMSRLAGEAGDSYVVPASDITLYAKWSANPLTYDFTWEQRGDTIAVTGSKNVAEVVIPERINGLVVTEIDEDAFADDTTLTTLSLPEGLRSIGAYAFYGSGLLEVTLPDTVETVGQGAFAECSALEEFACGAGLSALSEGMLASNAALLQLTLPEGVPDRRDLGPRGLRESQDRRAARQRNDHRSARVQRHDRDEDAAPRKGTHHHQRRRAGRLQRP